MIEYGVITGPVIPLELQYELSFKAGANLVMVPAMYGLGAPCFVLGKFKSQQATLANHQSRVSIVDPRTGLASRIVDNNLFGYLSFT